jgi:carbamate kinase
LTQIVVDRRDPAFHRPTKPVGPVDEEAEARRLAAERNWTVAPDGKGWRRLVASPAPVAILEARVIELLSRQGVTVICAGGGGIPVIERSDGSLIGVEAVIDKDHASALLARLLGADRLLLLTDVEAVYLGWGTDGACPIKAAPPGKLDPAAFSEGSMRPKVEAEISFVNETGRPAAIDRLEDVREILAGRAGTTVRLDADEIR